MEIEALATIAVDCGFKVHEGLGAGAARIGLRGGACGGARAAECPGICRAFLREEEWSFDRLRTSGAGGEDSVCTGGCPRCGGPSTALRPTAAAQRIPALGMPPACRPAYTPLPVPGRI